MTSKHYPATKSNINFSELENKVLSYWEKHDIFQKSVNNRPPVKQNNPNEFVLYDGPPFANGLPHYGHLLTGFIKDVFARYQTLLGKRVERTFGWDCHGLPAEMQSEKELGISGRNAILNYGIEKFNTHCRSSVMQYSNQWEEYITKQARWVDFKNSYKTMDFGFMESVIWGFKELYNKGLLYEAMKVMPYSWACETPLSNFETRLDNAFRERTDKAVTVSFILNLSEEEIVKWQKLYSLDQCTEFRILSWTTTPWTLPSNLALAIGPNIEYSFVPKENICYILGRFAIPQYAKELKINTEENFLSVLGLDVIKHNVRYKPLFNYFLTQKNAFQILAGNFVTEGEGTGVVHMAPGFGEEDQILCNEHNIKLVCPIDNRAKFTEEVPDLFGIHVFDANDKIIKKLKNQNNWIKTENYTHNYPHCWRTDTPLIYKAVPSWYIKVTNLKERMIEINKKINWTPYNVRDNLFGKWLENSRDWAISRNRFWGTPIPIWKSDDPNYPRIDVYGSVAELEKDFGVVVTDLHRPFVDQLIRKNPDDPTGKSMMRRVEEVLDCWFESGSMPYAQAHYPFENQDWFHNHFPADFIVEYSAQTRGWFYTLMVLSTALFDQPPFMNCICHGVILDKTGQKLSKRLNNYIDPLKIFNDYGSDALRATMLSSGVVKGRELLIDEDGKIIYNTLRLLLKPIWNAYHFFTMYANSDNVVAKLNFHSKNILDRYILSKLKITINSIKNGLDNFDTQIAYDGIAKFFDTLNNWYIRRSRQRFWNSDTKDLDKISAYDTLYTCLDLISKAMSPLLPVLAEEIYLGVNNPFMLENKSVHLTDYPDVTQINNEDILIKDMDYIVELCSTASFIRNTYNIRTRQPLKSLTIAGSYNPKISKFENLIKDEINVKTIIYKEKIDEYAYYDLNIHYTSVGKRLPHKIKDIILATKERNWSIEKNLLRIAGEELTDNEFSLILKPKISKGAKSLPCNTAIVLLDIEITKELYEEGIIRDLIRFIQQARKEADLNINEKIYIDIESDKNLKKIIEKYKNLVSEQTLSFFYKEFIPDYTLNIKLDEKDIAIKIKSNNKGLIENQQ